MKEYLAGFCFAAALNFFYAHFTLAANNRKPASAGFSASLITFLNGAIILSVVREPSVLIACLAGAFVGAFFCVSLSKLQG